MRSSSPGFEGHVALHQVLHHRLAVERALKRDHVVAAVWAQVEVAAVPVVLGLLALGLRGLADLGQALLGAGAAVGGAFLEHARDVGVVPSLPLRLTVGTVVSTGARPSSQSRPIHAMSRSTCASCSALERARSVSSMRSRKTPSCFRASSQLNRAVRAPPMCRWPSARGKTEAHAHHISTEEAGVLSRSAPQSRIEVETQADTRRGWCSRLRCSALPLR